MLAAITAINALQRESSTLKKQEILRRFKDNEDFRKLLYYALTPMLTYKVSEQTLSRSVKYSPEITLALRDIYTICETLSQRKAVDDATLCQICAFLNTCAPQEKELYTKLLAKTLRLGVTAKTVNKIIPGLIPEWEVQQAYPIDKYPLRDGIWFALTQKLNGVRATFYKGKLFARSGVPYEGLFHIAAALDVPELSGLVFDGELTLKEKGGLSDNEAFRKATGIINSDDEDKASICYTIFDVVPEAEFDRGTSTMTYSARRTLMDAISAALPCDGCVSILPTLYMGRDQSKIDELLEQMVREDKEGLMVNLDVPYKRKRHNGILKVKRFYTMDLPIVKCEEGSGRLVGTLGAFVLNYKGNEVRVGSGFTDEQREAYWRRRAELAGVLCEVKYKEISSDKNTGAESLQFPVFITLRTDKEDISYA